jgi:hypothetical protein
MPDLADHGRVVTTTRPHTDTSMQRAQRRGSW